MFIRYKNEAIFISNRTHRKSHRWATWNQLRFASFVENHLYKFSLFNIGNVYAKKFSSLRTCDFYILPHTAKKECVYRTSRNRRVNIIKLIEKFKRKNLYSVIVWLMFQLCYNSIKEEIACFEFMFQVEKNSLALLMRVSSFSDSIYMHFF